MSNFNVSLDTEDMAVGREVMKHVREKTGGLAGVSGKLPNFFSAMLTSKIFQESIFYLPYFGDLKF